MPSPARPATDVWAADLRRSVRLFRDFRLAVEAARDFASDPMSDDVAILAIRRT